jgi:hypothetical protein
MESDDEVSQLRKQLIAAAMKAPIAGKSAADSLDSNGSPDSQAQREREFQAQVEKHFSRAAVDDMLKKLKRQWRQPIDRAYLMKRLNRWKYSTCIPGRRLSWMLFDEKSRHLYVPLERQFEVVR